MKLKITVALILGFMLTGCAKRWHTTHEVPRVSPSFPYAMMVLDVEVGDTRRPELVFERMGYIDRKVTLRGDGIVVLRVIPGEWKIYVTGSPGESDVVTFGNKAKPAPPKEGEAKPSKAGPRSWPEQPLEVALTANKMTNVGRLCAHTACKKAWQPFQHEKLEAWRAARRLSEFGGPIAPAAPAKSESPGAKAKDGAGGDVKADPDQDTKPAPASKDDEELVDEP